MGPPKGIFCHEHAGSDTVCGQMMFIHKRPGSASGAVELAGNLLTAALSAAIRSARS
jgi:hypothetical protein